MLALSWGAVLGLGGFGKMGGAKEMVWRTYQDGSWVYAHHKRSKSSSDRNFSSSQHGVSYSTAKEPNGQQNLKHMMKTDSAQCSVQSENNPVKNSVLDQRALLENDIEQIQLCLSQERSMCNLLERAIGRTSSILSPGHRHFSSQIKELIEEIELLEQEVANREQHVLSLYRSIFNQSFSREPSKQSSEMASPVHTTIETRKHPTVISSSFCSSKNFPFPSLQVRASSKDSGRKKSLLHFKPRQPTPSFRKSNSENYSDPKKVNSELNARRNSLGLTLKDLHRCPSELSEELVRCMVAIYCWVCKGETKKPEKVRSLLLSAPCTNIILSRQSGEATPGKSMIKISDIASDKSNYSSASYAIKNYKLLLEELERVKIGQLEDNAKLAFWINIYNSLVMHAYLTYGVPYNSLKRVALFHKAVYNIAGHAISANTIEHVILSCRFPRASRWFESILSTAMRKKAGEEKVLIGSGFSLAVSNSLVCFALCSGAASDPVLKVFTASNVKGELESAKKEYVQANVVVKKSRKIILPKMLERYAKEASITMDDLLHWVSENVDKKLQDSIKKCMDNSSISKRKASHIIEWLPYDIRFHYIFAKDLTEKPWWL